MSDNPKCACGAVEPNVTPITGPDRWGIDPDNYDPICPACIRLPSRAAVRMNEYLSKLKK